MEKMKTFHRSSSAIHTQYEIFSCVCVSIGAVTLSKESKMHRSKLKTWFYIFVILFYHDRIYRFPQEQSLFLKLNGFLYMEAEVMSALAVACPINDIKHSHLTK